MSNSISKHQIVEADSVLLLQPTQRSSNVSKPSEGFWRGATILLLFLNTILVVTFFLATKDGPPASLFVHFDLESILINLGLLGFFLAAKVTVPLGIASSIVWWNRANSGQSLRAAQFALLIHVIALLFQWGQVVFFRG